MDRSGNVFVTGASTGSSGNFDSVTIKHSSSVPPPRLDFQLLNKELVLSWTNAGFNLQSAPAVTGTFTNLPGATSPFANPITGPATVLPAKSELTRPRSVDRDCVRRTSRSPNSYLVHRPDAKERRRS